MSFYNVYNKYENFNFDEFFGNVTGEGIKKAMWAERLNLDRFLTLLSPGAGGHLEGMAKMAHRITVQYFGKAIQLYTPMYLSNYCENECVYCGFNRKNPVHRKKLTLDEVEKEARFIASWGMRHILILTGESRRMTPLPYIKSSIDILKKYFSSISIEIYPLTEDEYGELIEVGLDGLTIYQEVYERGAYDRVHLSGPKQDYMFRLNAPERALKKGMRTVSIGCLLGLREWREEAFFTGLHAQYLKEKFPEAEISVSLPRIRPSAGGFKPKESVGDASLVQIILALRIFLPRLGITLSTRECSELRDNLLPLGVTKISAGSTTKVGGHTLRSEEANPEQFEISDKRTLAEIKNMLSEKRYQPVLKDWMGNG